VPKLTPSFAARVVLERLNFRRYFVSNSASDWVLFWQGGESTLTALITRWQKGCRKDPFRPGTTLRKVIQWARDKFTVDKKEKLVLRLDSPESESLDPDSHVGSYVSHPHCHVTFYLTPSVKIQG
jgi:hypothetical protein